MKTPTRSKSKDTSRFLMPIVCAQKRLNEQTMYIHSYQKYK